VSEEQNKTLVRNSLEASWKKRDWAEAAKYIAADHINHGPLTDQLPSGPEGNKAFVSGMVAAFPDVRYTIDKQEAEGDLVRTWLTYVGTNTGSLMGMPPTGQRATVKVLTTDRIANGKIVESWAEWDDADMMRQLGIG
jgi:predicted ester cyclase